MHFSHYHINILIHKSLLPAKINISPPSKQEIFEGTPGSTQGSRCRSHKDSGQCPCEDPVGLGLEKKREKSLVLGLLQHLCVMEIMVRLFGLFVGSDQISTFFSHCSSSCCVTSRSLASDASCINTQNIHVSKTIWNTSMLRYIKICFVLWVQTSNKPLLSHKTSTWRPSNTSANNPGGSATRRRLAQESDAATRIQRNVRRAAEVSRTSVLVLRVWK